ncbi:hypothetical protein HK405_013082 [Cladochytrium tenue]|nr:hypothetical protein HK405_013082 [Cladochytrium tenue]
MAGLPWAMLFLTTRNYVLRMWVEQQQQQPPQGPDAAGSGGVSVAGARGVTTTMTAPIAPTLAATPGLAGLAGASGAAQRARMRLTVEYGTVFFGRRVVVSGVALGRVRYAPMFLWRTWRFENPPASDAGDNASSWLRRFQNRERRRAALIDERAAEDDDVMAGLAAIVREQTAADAFAAPVVAAPQQR